MTLKFIFPGALILIFLCGCGHPENYDTSKVQKASLQLADESTNSKVIHFDYDKNEKRLVRKFEPVTEKDSDKLKIAIKNFLAKTNFRGNYQHLRFDYADFKSDSITFYFKGNFDFDRIDDEEIFKKALELTITNYTNNLNIDLVFNDNKF